MVLGSLFLVSFFRISSLLNFGFSISISGSRGVLGFGVSGCRGSGVSGGGGVVVVPTFSVDFGCGSGPIFVGIFSFLNFLNFGFSLHLTGFAGVLNFGVSGGGGSGVSGGVGGGLSVLNFSVDFGS